MLCLALTDKLQAKEERPAASCVDAIHGEGNVLVVPFDQLEYNRKHNNRAVKKTLTIPEWLNEQALAMNVNFSQVLQDALMEKVMGAR